MQRIVRILKKNFHVLLTTQNVNIKTDVWIMGYLIRIVLTALKLWISMPGRISWKITTFELLKVCADMIGCRRSGMKHFTSLCDTSRYFANWENQIEKVTQGIKWEQSLTFQVPSIIIYSVCRRVIHSTLW